MGLFAIGSSAFGRSSAPVKGYSEVPGPQRITAWKPMEGWAEGIFAAVSAVEGLGGVRWGQSVSQPGTRGKSG